MYDGGCFGGYTRWAVVFLIIFVLLILLVPYGYVKHVHQHRFANG